MTLATAPHRCDTSHDGTWEEVGAEVDVLDEWPQVPNPMLPVSQLYLRDVPLLRPPGQADLLQVLWCPYEYEPAPTA
ncbi:hypothetical protein ACIBG6_31030 [Streptomyces sp. NPDC050842]|uniref:hypothetical protein n=1 Tax=Streptomyces sp. NPDC050842 TaxID=3365636 RepID=UPI003792E2EB